MRWEIFAVFDRNRSLSTLGNGSLYEIGYYGSLIETVGSDDLE